MPYNDADPADPMQLTGVGLEAPAEGAESAAHAYAEDLARSGASEGRIMAVFESPEYRGPHGVYRALGREYIHEMVADYCVFFEACRAASRGRRGGPRTEGG